MQVSIIGTGYVGLTTATALAYLGHEVHCIDQNPAVVESLSDGRVPIHEPGVKELLAMKVSFINEFAGLAEHVGADITEVARGMGLDDRIGMRYLMAGAGWGGSCFGKDVSAILHTAPPSPSPRA